MVDVTNPDQVDSFFEKTRPKLLFMAAAKVGGLMANFRNPVQFLSENILAQTYVINAAHKYDVDRLVFLGSSCIYPRNASQPISENSLLTGPLEVTNEAYAIAKISGVKLIQSYRRQYSRAWISVMPTNLFGLNDNFDLENSHALAAIMRKMHDAKIAEAESVQLWGTGSPRREFMYSDDFAGALLFVADNYDNDAPINIGTGEDLTIRELATMIKQIVGFKGEVVWNDSIPDGTPRKQLDISRLRDLGWQTEVDFLSGLRDTYNWFSDNYAESRLNVPI
jgi:GDP-L-fucose synthase